MLHALDGLGLEVSTYPDCSGVAAVLHGDEPGPVVLLRADMDALPITEETGVDYAFDGPRHARVRSRPAHDHAGRGGARARHPESELARFGGLHVPTGGGGVLRGPAHDRRRRPERRRSPRRRRVRVARRTRADPPRCRRHPAGTVAGVGRPPPRGGPRRDRARRPSSPGARSGPGRGRDRHRAAHRGDPSIRHLRSGRRVRWPARGGRGAQRDRRVGSHRRDDAFVLGADA